MYFSIFDIEIRWEVHVCSQIMQLQSPSLEGRTPMGVHKSDIAQALKQGCN